MTTERKNNISFQLIFPEVELVRKDSDGFYKVKPKNPIEVQTYILQMENRPPEYIEKILSMQQVRD